MGGLDIFYFLLKRNYYEVNRKTKWPNRELEKIFSKKIRLGREKNNRHSLSNQQYFL